MGISPIRQSWQPRRTPHHRPRLASCNDESATPIDMYNCERPGSHESSCRMFPRARSNSLDAKCLHFAHVSPDQHPASTLTLRCLFSCISCTSWFLPPVNKLWRLRSSACRWRRVSKACGLGGLPPAKLCHAFVLFRVAIDTRSRRAGVRSRRAGVRSRRAACSTLDARGGGRWGWVIRADSW